MDDLDEALAIVKQNGTEALQMGTAVGSVRFAYLDTAAELGIVIEFIQIGKPKKRNRNKTEYIQNIFLKFF